jgi:hypothetical protein
MKQLKDRRMLTYADICDTGRSIMKQLKGTPKHIPIFESPCKSFNDGPRFLSSPHTRHTGVVEYAHPSESIMLILV